MPVGLLPVRANLLGRSIFATNVKRHGAGVLLQVNDGSGFRLGLRSLKCSHVENHLKQENPDHTVGQLGASEKFRVKPSSPVRLWSAGVSLLYERKDPTGGCVASGRKGKRQVLQKCNIIRLYIA